MGQKRATQIIKGYLNFLKESDYILLEPSKSRKKRAGADPGNSIQKRTKAFSLIASEIASCKKCRLAENRTQTVPGDGGLFARLVFVGEAPGYYEDQQGIPFVGKAGRLLDRLLANIGMTRDNVFICNVVKCRPPGNRDPLPDEIEACEPFLLRQLDLLKPLVICALGRYATQTLLRTKEGINRLRGSFYLYHDIPLLPTFHPASVLRNPSQLEQVQGDFELIKKKLEEITR